MGALTSFIKSLFLPKDYPEVTWELQVGDRVKYVGSNIHLQKITGGLEIIEIINMDSVKCKAGKFITIVNPRDLRFLMRKVK